MLERERESGTCWRPVTGLGCGAGSAMAGFRGFTRMSHLHQKSRIKDQSIVHDVCH